MDLQCIKGVPCEEVTLSKPAGAMGWLMALLFLNMGGIYLSMNYTSTRYNRSTMEKYCEIYSRLAASLLESDLDTQIKDLLAE